MVIVQEIETITLLLAKTSGSFSQQRSEVVLKCTCHSFQWWLWDAFPRWQARAWIQPVTWVPTKLLGFGVFFNFNFNLFLLSLLILCMHDCGDGAICQEKSDNESSQDRYLLSPCSKVGSDQLDEKCRSFIVLLNWCLPNNNLILALRLLFMDWIPLLLLCNQISPHLFNYWLYGQVLPFSLIKF